jgi:hypothetical protein
LAWEQIDVGDFNTSPKNTIARRITCSTKEQLSTDHAVIKITADNNERIYKEKLINTGSLTY